MQFPTTTLVFISYRRSDTSGTTGRLADSLKQYFDPRYLFVDVENIERGEKFPAKLKQCIDDCKVFVLVIGPGWLPALQQTISDGHDDWVKNEVVWAIKKKKYVLPILVQGAQMPAAAQLPADLKILGQFNAAELTHQRWAYDVEQIAQTLAQQGVPLAKDEKRSRRQSYFTAVGVVVVLLIIFIGIKELFFSPAEPIKPLNRTPATLVAATPPPNVEGRWQVLSSAQPTGTWYQLSQNNYQLVVEQYVDNSRTATTTGFVNGNREVSFSLSENNRQHVYSLKLSADGRKLVGRMTGKYKAGNQEIAVPIAWEHVP